jgi:hypothetical protein
MSAFHEFYLPNVDFGQGDLTTENGLDGAGYCAVRDRIEFRIDGQTWTLRRLLTKDGECVTADAAFAAARRAGQSVGKLEYCPHAMLQVGSKAVPLETVAKMAEDICWLLQLALGQTVTWVCMRHQDLRSYPNTTQRNVRLATSVNHNRPLTNTTEVKLASYLEVAYPLYQRDPEWWRMTLDWFATVQDTKVVQVAGLLGSMLLERATTFVLKDKKFPEQIEAGLDSRLKAGAPDRAALIAELDALLARRISAKWEGHRSEAIVNLIRGWNNAPPYKKKVETAFAMMGLPPPDKKMLDHRDRLAHRGELEAHAENLTEYYAQISDAVISLLLRMLGYTGPYFVLGAGEVRK